MTEIDESAPKLIDPKHIVGVAEIATLFLVPRTTVSNWHTRTDRNGFPLPLVVLAAGPLFDVNEVLRWYARYVPLKGGRPGRAPGAEQVAAALAS